MLPGDQEDDDVQYLLNTFVLFNILEVFAILGLAYLDHKQKERAAHRTSIISIPESLDESEDEDGATKAARAEGEDDWQAEPSAGASAHSRRGSSFSRVSRASLSSPEQSIPLLGSGAHASTPRGSRYFIDAAAPEGTGDRPVKARKARRTKSEVKRGEVFAVISGILIASAWVLFMGTAWYRLRSKEERGGGGS